MALATEAEMVVAMGEEKNKEFIPLSIIIFRINELRHKRMYGCRKKRLNIRTFF